MLYSLKGKLIHREPNVAVIECGGVGFRCHITMTTARQLPAPGEQAMLYTRMNVRDDAIELFGFADRAELGCFNHLISVTGVGPKVALAVLSGCRPSGWRLPPLPGITRRLQKRRASVQSWHSASCWSSRTNSASALGYEFSRCQYSLGRRNAGELSAPFGSRLTSGSLGRRCKADSSLPVETLVREALKMLAKRG